MQLFDTSLHYEMIMGIMDGHKIVLNWTHKEKSSIGHTKEKSSIGHTKEKSSIGHIKSSPKLDIQ